MICDSCGKKGARVRKLTRTYGKGKDALLIEDVPVISCPHCGESYMTVETVRELERIRMHWKAFSVRRPVAVARYSKAA